MKSSAEQFDEESVVASLRVGLSERSLGEPQHIERVRRQRRQSSFVARYRVVFPNGEQEDLWAKVLHANPAKEDLKRRLIIRDYDLNCRVYQAFSGDSRFRVPPPLFSFPEQRLIVTRHTPGVRLHDKLLAVPRFARRADVGDDLMHSFRACGQWLRRFQETTDDYYPGAAAGEKPPPKRDIHRLADMTLERITALLDTHYKPLLRCDWEGVRAYVARQCEQAETLNGRTCAVHGDFFPGNLLLDGDGVVGLDFVSAGWGEPLFDLSYFVFQVETWAQRSVGRQHRQLIDAFLKGYDPALSYAGFWSASPVLRLLFVNYRVARLLSLVPKRPTTWHRRISRHCQIYAAIRDLQKALPA